MYPTFLSNTAYSVQQTDTAYSNSLNTAYRSPDITTETDSSYLIFCMKKSSTKELLTPFKNPEREFCSSRKLFKTPSLEESSSPEFDLFSDLEEHFEEEVAGIMAETMEEYITKTSDGLAAIQAQLNNLGREIKKVNEKVYAAQVGCELLGQYRASTPGFYQRNNANPSYQERRQSTEESLSKFMNESAKRHEENSNLIKEIRAFTDAAIRNQGASIKDLEIQIGKMSKVLQERGSGSLPSSTKTNLRDHVNSISTTVETDPTPIRYDCYDEEMGSYEPKDFNAYSIGTTLHNDALPQKEKDPGSFTLPCYLNNVYFEKALDDLGASVSVMPLSTYLNLGLGKLAHTKLTVELADMMVKHPKGIAKNILVGIGKFVFHVDFIILDMPKDVNVPLILGRPFLSTAHAKVNVFQRKITLRVRDEKIIFKSVKPASSLIKRVYMLSLRERMDLDLEAMLMGETLILNRSFDLLYGD
ncbi:hypothetical protein Tco_0425097 [Tanacetum coccineum]